MDLANQRLSDEEKDEGGTMNDELKSPNPDRALWEELAHLDAAAQCPNIERRTPRYEFLLCPSYWIGLPGEERTLYLREDVHEKAVLAAYRNGRAYERHAQRFLVAAVGIFGAIFGAGAVLVIFELVMR